MLLSRAPTWDKGSGVAITARPLCISTGKKQSSTGPCCPHRARCEPLCQNALQPQQQAPAGLGVWLGPASDTGERGALPERAETRREAWRWDLEAQWGPVLGLLWRLEA